MLNGFTSTSADFSIAKEFFLHNQSDRVSVMIQINTNLEHTRLVRLKTSKFQYENEYLSPLNIFLEF